MLVREGETVRIPLVSDGEPGAVIQADRVLMLNDEGTTRIGDPVVSGAAVSLEITGHGKDRTIHVYKKKRRKGYRRHNGHRQAWTEAVVTEITGA